MPGPGDEQSTSEGGDEGALTALKQRRKNLRCKITRSRNRLRNSIAAADDPRRIQREMKDVKKDFDIIREVHSEMYQHVDESQTAQMDDWENELTREFYNLEQEVDDYIMPQPAQASNTQDNAAVQAGAEHSGGQSVVNSDNRDQTETAADDNSSQAVARATDTSSTSRVSDTSFGTVRSSQTLNADSVAFDSWIDDLEEFAETSLSAVTRELTVAEALYKLEASRDIPQVQLVKFDGSPLAYIEFMERFKIQVHSKPHLTDEQRMLQLKMHLTGSAERAISGLGSQGIMYATALKTLKEHYGQPSAIARAFTNKLVNGNKMSLQDKSALREFSLDIVNAIAALKRLNYYADINATDNLRRIVKRLPESLVERWKSKVIDIRASNMSPDITHVSTFVRKYVKAQFDPDFGDLDVEKQPSNKESKRGHGVYTAQPSDRRQYNGKCYVCEQAHRVADCPTFKDSTVDERYSRAKELRLCFSCLNKGHGSYECRSKRKCGIEDCTREHHRLLHNPKGNRSNEQTNDLKPLGTVVESDVMLPVIRVKFRAPNGRIREGNVLMDGGAGVTIVREDFSRSLGLQGKNHHLGLSLVGGETIESSVTRKVDCLISSIHGGEEYRIQAYEVKKTALDTPALDRDWVKTFPHLRGLSFTHKAGPIDVILGVQYTHLHADMEVRQGRPFEPLAKKSVLGWYLMGPSNGELNVMHPCNVVQTIDLDNLYNMESVTVNVQNHSSLCGATDKLPSPVEQKVLEMFEQSCTKMDKRYAIGLPWKRDPEELKDNHVQVEKRLVSLEKQLARDPQKAEHYKAAMNEYLENGWAQVIPEEEINGYCGPKYYLPHHGVYRPDHPTTPLRIVFDPATPYAGASLNSFFYKGPNLIGDLYGVLVRFREEDVAFMGDVAKMYLQICLPERDTHVHRFLWRNLEDHKPPSVYRLMRVPFGDKPSPDMASFVLLHLAEKNAMNCQLAATIIQRDRYMDDLIHSCPSQQQAQSSIAELEQVLEEGCFRIKHWHCSYSDPPDEASPRSEINLDGQNKLKTLGLGWNNVTDEIRFVVRPICVEKLTKRSVLSAISRLYDPLGLVSAVTVRARIALQDVWRERTYDWDDPLPESMEAEWRQIFKDIEDLQTVRFPRCVKPKGEVDAQEIHIFADASIKAYGAVAYMRTSSAAGIDVRIMTAKAKVAPLKQATIPRLELMAALVASRLGQTVFVGVRVAEIQSTWPTTAWRYVPTDSNPADDISRGIRSADLEGTSRWKHGPSFLYLPENEWPQESRDLALTDDTEYKKPLLTVQVHQCIPDPERFSSWPKLVRVTAYVLRFVANVRAKLSSKEKTVGMLQPCELQKAENHCLQDAQSSMSQWKDRYQDLAPFQDDDGLIRVGGRLRKAQLEYDQVHPLLLPHGKHVAKLIMRETHEKMGHVGPERTLCESRRKYWIVRGRNLAKLIVRECLTCRKLRQPSHSTLMADLLPERLKPFNPPFYVTGVDLFGPFWLRVGRNKKAKAWGAIFTCANTRALHLEIVEDQSAQAFLQALRRFSCHHGWPNTIISDNGGSFIGARKELKQLFQEGKKQLMDFASLHKVRWILTTPLSPHQGGIYESLIKQVKQAMTTSIGNQTLTWNEMATAFAEVKCLVNSRPIGFASNDPNDSRPITPNHFILGRASAEIPQGPFRETKNLRKRFEFVQMLMNHFWVRFTREYLPTLTRRTKWTRPERQCTVGDIVLLVDYNLPRGKWNVARVEEVYPGQDGIVRNVKVRTQAGVYNRSVQRLCILLEDVESATPVPPEVLDENSQ